MNRIQTTLTTCAVATVLGGLSASAQTLELQLTAANYNAVSGAWADSSGLFDNAAFYGTLPTLVSGATPTGASAVDLPGNGGFTIPTGISGASGYTIFAVIAPTVDSVGGNRYALTGGNTGSLEYNLYQGHQNWLNEYVGNGGPGTGTIPTGSFSLVDLTVSGTGGTFHLNSAADGTTGAGTFGTALTRIGNNHGGGDGFQGDIAEIDIYSGVLTSGQIATEEAALTSEYITVPEPSSWVMLAGGLGTLIAVRRFRRA
jgi:hypothetical protein